MTPDVTFQLTPTQLVVRLRRPDMGTMHLQLALQRIKLSLMDAGSTCDKVERNFTRKLLESQRGSVSLAEMALIGAIMRDYFTNKLRADGGSSIIQP